MLLRNSNSVIHFMDYFPRSDSSGSAAVHQFPALSSAASVHTNEFRYEWYRHTRVGVPRWARRLGLGELLFKLRRGNCWMSENDRSANWMENFELRIIVGWMWWEFWSLFSMLFCGLIFGYLFYSQRASLVNSFYSHMFFTSSLNFIQLVNFTHYWAHLMWVDFYYLRRF